MTLRALLLSLFLAAPLSAWAGENTILLHNGKLDLHFPSEWTIIGHRPAGNKTVIAFQLHDNPAEEDTPDSTNIVVSTYNLQDTESMLAFTGPLLEEKEGSKSSGFEGWALNEWQGKQKGTPYKIVDASVTGKDQSAGIQVRLAWPLIKDNPKDYDARMMELLKKLLKDIATRNNIKPDPEEAAEPKAGAPKAEEHR